MIGEHIVMARQAADGKWLIGAATNEDARETLRTEKRQVSPTDILRLRLAPGGGACVLLENSTAP